MYDFVALLSLVPRLFLCTGRRSGAFLAILALLGLSACAPEPVVRRHHHTPTDAPDPATPPVPEEHGLWAHFKEIAGFEAMGEVAHSAHRLGTDHGKISRSTPAGAPRPAIYLEAVSGESGEPDVFYAMERKGPAEDRFDFLVVRPDGTIAAKGLLPLCVRCHAEAAPSLVFPVRPSP